MNTSAQILPQSVSPWPLVLFLFSLSGNFSNLSKVSETQLLPLLDSRPPDHVSINIIPPFLLEPLFRFRPISASAIAAGTAFERERLVKPKPPREKEKKEEANRNRKHQRDTADSTTGDSPKRKVLLRALPAFLFLSPPIFLTFVWYEQDPKTPQGTVQEDSALQGIRKG